ncbi:Pentatricopeptide repeat (PPR) superfamily protein [Euphorbia peplus]|nr:Pentatricopeptide repeat (PPR) superfamily protein [Euphorbia peplus]
MLKLLRKPHTVLSLALFHFRPISTSSSHRYPIKLLKLSADSKNLKHGKMIHAYFITTNQEHNTIEINSLVNFYAKCDQLLVARKLFDNMHTRNVVSWGALMAGYLHDGFLLQVITLFKDMVSETNIRPNEYIFATVLSSCSRSGRVKEGLQCHGFVFKCGLMFHQYVRNALMHIYSKYLCVREAMWIFDSVPRNDIFSYNSVMSGLVQNGYFREGVEVLRKIVSECMNWDNVTYVNLFGLCASTRDKRLGLQVHGKLITSDVKVDEYISSAIINFYGRCGETLKARTFFDDLQSENVVLWTATISAYFQSGCFEEALHLFGKVKLAGVAPNEFTFAVLLNACAGLSALRYGYLLHACIEKSAFKDHLIVGNALINMYAKGGNIEAAYKVFSGMIYRDTITWNAMICGYSHHGLGNHALQVFEEMLTAEEHPNYVTFVGVLSSCSHLGFVKEGFYYLTNLMKHFRIEPGLEHYTCIVGLLSKAGRLDDAINFMRSTPVKWDVVAWRTLLNACHVLQNYDMGKWIAELLLRMDPDNVGTYILLSNMYAKAKMWDGVAKMRKLMRNKNIKKEPGVSWIEIKNATHVFVSEDIKHPDYVQIYKKVNELLDMIRPLGYVPDTSAVLHDIEDEQRDDHLSYHSEKLAIAYGFLRIHSGAPIIVIKNLRMCADCHLAVKLISKVTDRLIIVRDTNRFHHFKNGSCSCADYW